MNTKVALIILLLLGLLRGQAQITPLPEPENIPDTTVIEVDTLPVGVGESLRVGVPISKDSLDAAVDYSARDSMKIDARLKKIHLYGQAKVTYENLVLEAAHIELSWETNEVIAEGRTDSSGRLVELPVFTEGERNFTADRMRYNFSTRKGVVYDVVSQEKDVIVRGSRSKFVSADPSDTTSNDIIYSEDAIFTTCTAEHPHFLIRSRRQKVIPDKLVIVGPSNLEIMGVPTPLWLPFGFFPLSSGRQTGLLFPRDYEYSPQLGFGIQGLGWFFPIGEHFNLSVTGNIYLKGTWGLTASSQYRKRYKYNGNFAASYDSRKVEDLEGFFTRSNAFYLRWSHNQDPAAHPSVRLGGNINFQTNGFQQRVLNDRSVLNNTINSNFSFSKNWLDKPISMSLAFQHSQNTRSREVTVDFPSFQFQTQTLYPFRRRDAVGRPRWYENVTLRYTNEARARFIGTDTSFFSSRTIDQANYGVKHDFSSGTSLKILKYFNLNPSASYREVWYFKSLEKNFVAGENLQLDTIVNPDGSIRIDTLVFGSIVTDTVPGFSSFRTYSASLSLNTQIFGTILFNRGPIRGLRHVIKPSISFGYNPDYTNPNLKYFPTVPDSLDPQNLLPYNRYQNFIFGGPPQSERQMGINYSISNIFEAKVRDRRDTLNGGYKNIKLFDNIYINGSYNFAADSLKWSPISLSGAARFFKGTSVLSFRSTFSPYARYFKPGTTRGVLINRTTWQESRRPFELVSAQMTLNTNLTVAKIRAIFQGKEEEVVENIQDEENAPPREIVETDFLSLFENFSIRHNLAFSLTEIGPRNDTLRIDANSIELRGSIRLTPNWDIDVGSIGYDFTSKRITYPYLGFSRDLHCWEMGFNWAPVRNTYSFYLRVKPGTLDFLKFPYQRNNVDGANVFQ